MTGGNRKRNYSLFLLSLLLSFTVWFIHNMSQEYSDIVTVNVWAESNLEGRAVRCAEPVSVVARCTAAGFRHLGAGLRRKVVTVTFDKGDMVHGKGDFYRVEASALGKYAPAIFGDFIHPDTYITPALQFRFPAENNKKVPVLPVNLVSYRPQYMAAGPVTISPDSVVVYGDPKLLSGIDKVFTKQISRTDVRGSLHGVIGLEAPAGVRLSDSEVTYSIEVYRFVELRTKVVIGTRNVPSGKRLSVLPSTAEVSLRCVFPLIGNPEDRLDAFIDYSDFAASKTGHCLARFDSMPEGVLSIDISPQVFECVETQ